MLFYVTLFQRETFGLHIILFFTFWVFSKGLAKVGYY